MQKLVILFLSAVFFISNFFDFLSFVLQLDVSNDSFQNVLSTKKFDMQRNKNKLGTVPDRSEYVYVACLLFMLLLFCN